MRASIVFSAAVLLLAFAVSPASAIVGGEGPTASPNSPTSGELVDFPGKWDGKQITFTGEAITEALERGDYAWVHLNDDAYHLKSIEEGAALGGYNSGQAVWMPRALAEKIEFYGDYRHHGDVVTVRGTFNAACPQHGGDMDIHAESLDVTIGGRDVREPVGLYKVLAAIVLLVLAAVLWAANRRATHLEMFGALTRWWR